MTISCRPSLSAVTRIVSVLHARKAEIRSLHYSDGSMVVGVSCGDSARLAAQLRRVVEVTAVAVSVTRPVAVAS